MANTRPYVAVACICEKVVIEKDDAATLVRIVDTYTAKTDLPIDPKDRPDGIGRLKLTMFVSLKSGDVTGPSEIALNVRQPNGKNQKVGPWPIVLKGGVHGVNLKVEFELLKANFGTYWFDVGWGSEVLTSIPLVLKLGMPRDE